jgi:uncharacterized protein (TIGR02145 family)
MNIKSILSLLLLSLIIFSCDTKATLEIKSNVEDAEIFINEKSVGAAPITVSVESGETAVTLKKEGYSDYKTKVSFEGGEKKVLTANMKAIASVTLEVNANIDDADVFLNSKLIGKTPLIKKVTSGNVKISVRKQGYKNYNESVNLLANSEANIEAELITDLDAISTIDEAAFKNNDQGQFTDIRDGQLYKWTKIKNKIWMTENMNFPVDARSWPYANDSTNREAFGMLYSQRGANEAANIRGWRVPTDAEWQALINSYGNNAYAKLSDGGSRGFNVTQGGFFNYFAKYADKGALGYYWSSTRNDSCDLCGFSWIFDSQSKTIYQNSESFISKGFSVRLVRDVTN